MTCSRLFHTAALTIRLTKERCSDPATTAMIFPTKGLPSRVNSLVIDIRTNGRDHQSASDTFVNLMSTSIEPSNIREAIITLDTCRTIHRSDDKEGHPILSFLASLPSLKVLRLDRFDQGYYPWQEDSVLLQSPFLDRLSALEEIAIRFTGESYLPTVAARSSSRPRISISLVCNPDDHANGTNPINWLMQKLAETIRGNLKPESTGKVNVIDATQLLARAARQGENLLPAWIPSESETVGESVVQAVFEASQPVELIPHLSEDLSLPDSDRHKVHWIEESVYGHPSPTGSSVRRFHSRANRVQ